MRNELSRRHLLKSAAAAGVGLAAMKSKTFAADAPTFKAGLIGCGGRGNGAGNDILEASKKSGIKVEITAVADVYEGQAKGAARRFNVDAARTFWDFDGYKKLIDSGVDIVLLATPPGYRPEHFEAVIAAGKHCFTEKPVATFAQDCRRFIKAAEESVKKNLTVVAGTQRRHQRNYVETVAKINEGAIGDVRALRAYWCGGPVMKGQPRKPGQKDMDFQLKAWYSFVWICGDQIVEQHLHNLDVCNWVMRGHPVSVYASGGCAWRPKEEWFGNIYDHLTADYTYPNGVHMLSMCRQYKGCDDNVSEAIVGADGESNGVSITRKGQTVFNGPGGENPYVQEHIDMLKNIVRGGQEPLLNEGVGVGESTMTAIMGRISAYTGKVVTWDKVMSMNDSQMPESSWDAKIPIPPVAVPGA